MKLFVGLGNPGTEYVGSRHNVGFEVLDTLAGKLGIAASAKTKFQGLIVDGQLPNGEKVMLLKPMTYMNESGRSVQAAVAFYQLPLEDLLIVSDDLALPCGRMRLRPDGSPGGHNGLADIERALATPKYPRLRIGIDPKPAFIPQRDYVLSKFTKEQRNLIDATLPKAAEAAICWAENGVTTAMNRYNTKDGPKDDA
ncbi:MAG TPA: aminoacyl-tRNA hydrolase [Tepidisphaeraceae bacterium]|nr:aminoacyl-tRNA hydrolase [Tepidisphaeraceae bacterium]